MDLRQQNELVAWLERLADQDDWNPEIWQKCFDLISENKTNDICGYLYDDLVHYSGALNSVNLLGFRTQPDQHEVEDYQYTFRSAASALRLSLSLEEARRKFDF